MPNQPRHAHSSIAIRRDVRGFLHPWHKLLQDAAKSISQVFYLAVYEMAPLLAQPSLWAFPAEAELQSLMRCTP